MRYESTQHTNDFVYEDGFENLEADSFSEFARALLMGLGVVLLISIGTFLIISGLVATLLGMVS